ncbi:Na+/H+-exchanging protein [Flavobacterium enshiense DK69]|uniref:Transporter n=1 Tax=Flavobacterium enshiense DK69 TaxID=1107311 RepID=V6SG40_9FLAO|nr:cation:proton antiporter [Flavobacterium enshiense]ESU25212.1 Na+/H+-exchanging protein [Flavobacterium enshiense DK69]KGO96895.1 transporter [Flavobacterium enshiense DK69]
MKKFKNSFFYIGIVGVTTAIMYWTIQNGKILEEGRNVVLPNNGKSQWEEFIISLTHNLTHPLAILLAQIVTIVFVARLFGAIFKKIGQPSVIGEILAGIALGPSLLGNYFPEFSNALFPAASLGNLQFLSQIGLILFMFVVGMELDLKVLQNKAKEAVIISHASIVIPFTLGLVLAYFIFQQFAPDGVEFISFALFTGIAMSITAFPVLARIVQERGLHKTRLGAMVITCAAADDITAWCILAAVIAIVKAGSFLSSLYIMALAIVYVMLMLKVVKPFLKRIGDLYDNTETITKPVIAIFFLTLLISSYATEVIGIHALFGAFMAGVIMPESMRFRNIFIEKVEDVSQVMLLPLFFVFTGLRTQIGLLDDAYLWEVCGYIVLVAVVGKFVGSALTARFVGQSWKDSLTIGALMNTRGLMELVVLNIGYDLGVLKPEIFAMMVIMALATTFMTGPALDLIEYVFKSKTEIVPKEIVQNNKFKVLFSFHNAEEGRSLLRLANNFVKKNHNNSIVTAMHILPINELNPYNIDEYEEESFKPILQASEELHQKVTTLFKSSIDTEGDLIEVSNQGDFDLVLMSLSQSIFEGTLLGKVLGFTTRIINPESLLNKFTGKEKLFENSPFDERTEHVLSRTDVPVGILVDKNFTDAKRVFVLLLEESDLFLMDYAKQLIHNVNSNVTVLDKAGNFKNNTELIDCIHKIEHKHPKHIKLATERKIEKALLDEQDLMIISVESWKKLLDSQSSWLNKTPSLLIIKK